MKPSAIRVLKMLQAHQPHAVPSTVLCQPDVGGIDFRRRIHEIRTDSAGYVVKTEDVPGKSHKAYRLVLNAEVTPEAARAAGAV